MSATMNSVKVLCREEVDSFLHSGAPLGEGSFGVVRRIRWNRKHPVAVIKVAKSNDLEEEKEISLHLNGAGGAPRVLGECEDPPALVITYAGDETLRSYLCRVGEHASPSNLLRIGVLIGKRLMELQRAGVVHNDIHMENIMTDHTLAASAPQVSIIDYGMACYNGGNLNLNTHYDLSKHYWICPEVRQGRKSTFAGDVYSYAMLLRLIFLNCKDGIPSEISQIVNQGINKNPMRRPLLPNVLDTLSVLLGKMQGATSCPTANNFYTVRNTNDTGIQHPHLLKQHLIKQDILVPQEALPGLHPSEDQTKVTCDPVSLLNLEQDDNKIGLPQRKLSKRTKGQCLRHNCNFLRI